MNIPTLVEEDWPALETAKENRTTSDLSTANKENRTTPEMEQNRFALDTDIKNSTA